MERKGNQPLFGFGPSEVQNKVTKTHNNGNQRIPIRTRRRVILFRMIKGLQKLFGAPMFWLGIPALAIPIILCVRWSIFSSTRLTRSTTSETDRLLHRCRESLGWQFPSFINFPRFHSLTHSTILEIYRSLDRCWRLLGWRFRWILIIWILHLSISCSTTLEIHRH